MSFAECDIQLHRADFSIETRFAIPGRGVLGIFGPSGSGKTTLLRCIAGLEKEASGRIELADEVWLDQDKNIPSQQRNVGYVFQDSRLFPHLSVADNLDYGMRRQNRPGEVIDRDDLLELLTNCSPASLSILSIAL